jgi:hypothetical protein
MTDREFLIWLTFRLINVYNENELTDFVHRLKAIAKSIDGKQVSDW